MTQLHSFFPNTTQQFNKRGSGIIILIITIAMLSSIIALSTAQISNVMFNSLKSSSIAMQAQQYSENKANILKATTYSNLAAQNKHEIQNTKFSDEVILGEEVDNEAYLSRTATINVYYNSESLPRVSLAVLRTNVPSSAGVPIGTIIAWPTDTLPTDGVWLNCNGQSTADYPLLAAVVGANVPDYRGVFLRGAGEVTLNKITHASDALGITQEDAIRNISGNFAASNLWASNSSFNFGDNKLFKVIGTEGDRGAVDNDGVGDNTGRVYDFNVGRVVPTSNENRPINIAVNYLIKAA